MRVPAYVTVFVVALAIRLIAWGFVESQIAADPGREFLIAGDAEGYWDLGTDLAAGREYTVYTPPRRVLRTPGVPMVVAASVAVFGESKVAARGVFAVLAAIGPVMIYGLGWRIGGRQLGLMAGLLAAVSPLAVGMSPVLLSDGLFAALLAWQLSVAGPLVGCGPSTGENAATPFRYAMLGIAAAAAVLVRPAWLPAVPIVFVTLVWACRLKSLSANESSPDASRAFRFGMLAKPLIFVAAFTVVMAPWVIRNAVVTDHFVPTSLWLGPTLYDSFGPDADGGSNMTFFDAEAGQRKEMSEWEVDQWYRNRAFDAAVDDPGRVVTLAAAKQGRFWSFWPRAGEVPSTVVRMAVACWSMLVIGLAMIGLWRGPLKMSTLILTLGPILYFALLHLVFVGSMRYRMPAELPLCVLAAMALHQPNERPKPA